MMSDIFSIYNPLVTICATLLIAYIFWCLIYYFIILIKAKEWGEAEGIVKSYKYKKGSLNNGTSNSLEVIYTYIVFGKEYKNNKLGLSEHAFSTLFFLARAELVNKLHTLVKSGEKLTVFYDKTNPSVSCLDKSLDYRAIYFSFLMTVGLIIVVMASGLT